MAAAERTSLKLGLGATLPAFGVTLTWLCCLPFALGGFGLGAGALGAALAPLRPWFIAAALLLLGSAFYSAYRRPACPTGDACELGFSRRRLRVVLWVTAAFTVAMLTVDRWASWVIYWSL